MKRLRNLALAALLLLATVVPAYAGPNDPIDQGFGIAYDTIVVTVLGVNPHVAGQSTAIVVHTAWSDGSSLAENTGIVTTFVRLPRAEDDNARAIDPTVLSGIDKYGNSIIGYTVPLAAIRPSEQVVTASVEIKVFAFTTRAFPSVAWGETQVDVAIGAPLE